jgi:phosphoenolpyruvate carboxylase
MTNAELIPDDDPEREDVRFLGRLLGDVIRAQEGEATFNRIEAIRQPQSLSTASVDGHTRSS